MADFITYFLQWGHVLMAVYLIGGGFFFEFFTKPQLQTLPPEQAGSVMMGISKNFTIFVHASWVILIFTGLWRAFVVLNLDIFTLHESLYGLILEVKIGVVILAYSASIYMTKLGLDLQKVEPPMRPEIAKKIGMVSRGLVVAGLVLVLLAVGLRNISYLQ